MTDETVGRVVPLLQTAANRLASEMTGAHRIKAEDRN
jgi:hypothetical protein